MNIQNQDLLAKKKRAINTVKCFTYFTEILMYVYGGIFIFGIINSVYSLKLYISFIINMALVMSCAHACEQTRKEMKKTPPNYKEAGVNFGMIICVMMTFFILYAISAVILYFRLEGDGDEDAFYFVLFIIFLASPHLLLSLIGFFVIRNFRILRPALALNQVGTSINNNSSLNGGYAKTP